MRLKEFIDPNKTLSDIMKGLDPSLLKGTTWEKPGTPAKAIKKTSMQSAPSKGEPAGNYKSGVGGRVNPKEIAAYLQSKGFDRNQIAGWLVNIKWESSFYPGAYVAVDAGQGQSGGFFGFHDVVNGKGLFTQMVKFTGGPNSWQTNWRGQLDFALQDPRGQKYRSTKFKTPGEAAHWWTTHYEKPKDTEKQASIRAANASKYA